MKTSQITTHTRVINKKDYYFVSTLIGENYIHLENYFFISIENKERTEKINFNTLASVEFFSKKNAFENCEMQEFGDLFYSIKPKGIYFFDNKKEFLLKIKKNELRRIKEFIHRFQIVMGGRGISKPPKKDLQIWHELQTEIVNFRSSEL